MRNTVVSLFRCFEDKNPKKVNLFQILTTPKFKSRIETLRAEEDEEKQKGNKERRNYDEHSFHSDPSN